MALLCYADVAQLARAPAFQAGCCGFESHRPLHLNTLIHLFEQMDLFYATGMK